MTYDPVREILGPLDGASIPGGCDFCEAVQVPRCVAKKVWVIEVQHDDDCPFLAQMEEA